MDIRVLPTAGLSDADRLALRRLFDAAYEGDFTDNDFDHALGGWHAIAGDLTAPIAHAAVVARSLRSTRASCAPASWRLSRPSPSTSAPASGRA